MRKILHLIVLIFISPLSAFSTEETDKLLKELEGHIENRESYEKQKQDKISLLLDSVSIAKYNHNLNKLYSLYDKLHEEYKSYTYDSAFKYVNELNTLALKLHDYEKIAHSKLKMGFTLLSSGLFKESLDTLTSISLSKCPTYQKTEYYITISRTYYDLADYDKDVHFAGIYRKIGNQYLDSAILLLKQNTPEYWLAMGLRKMKSDDYQGSVNAFSFVISNYKISYHQFAIASSSVSYDYTMLNRENEAFDMLIKAAIADITASTKETVALRNLAVLLLNRGDIDKAYKYIKIALEDATFYNARHRKIEVGTVLPIIEGERLRIVESQKKKLGNYSLVVTFLSLLVITFFIIIYLQLKRIAGARKILQETNANLQEMNSKLMEANIIKEEYIGHFFNITSEFIEKMEDYRKSIQRKIATRQFDDISSIIKSADLKKERENMYMDFDKIFLKLFPRFIEEFNKLFKEEDRISIKHGELLNSDLRIFALMRLGITDSEKIAKFLDYSVNTIYTYKNKIKNKTIVDRDTFDNRIMEIKAF